MNTSATSSFSALRFYFACADSTKGTYVFTAWLALYLLLFPLFLLVLYIGFTKWRQQRASATDSMSHFDVFTLHMTVHEILLTFGSVLFLVGLYRRHYGAASSGTALFGLTTVGQACLHSLTCMERYLAVVQPITYLHLKKRGGVTVRNVSIVVAWLVAVVYMLVLIAASDFLFLMVTHCICVGVVIAIVVFCSVSVLFVLIRPGPGESGGNRKRVNQSKLSAFGTILAILGVLMVRLVQLVVLALWPFLSMEPCVVALSTFWFSLPSSLVLPMLFLHRDGRLSAWC